MDVPTDSTEPTRNGGPDENAKPARNGNPDKSTEPGRSERVAPTETDVREAKQELRRRVRSARKEAAAAPAAQRAREQQARDLLRHAGPLLDLVESAARTATPRVAAFHPTPVEPDVMGIVDQLLQRRAEVVFPVSAGADLDWVAWDGRTDFVDSSGRGFGAEPPGARLGTSALRDAVLVLAPAMAVDRSGSRIGHGAGYYDRTLADIGGDTVVAAVVHPGELLEAGEVPVEASDAPIHVALTALGLSILRPHPLFGDMIAGGA